MTRMDCNEFRDLLEPYDDGELPPSERAAVAGHLEGCRHCAAALADLEALRRRIRGAGTFAAPASLEARIRLALGLEARGLAAFGWRRVTALAASHLAVAVLGGLLAYTMAARSDVRLQTTRDVVAAHQRSLIADQLVQVASAETHTVKPWFTGRVPFAPDVVDLSAQGFQLLGGRTDYVLDRPVAALVYGRRKHRINVFILTAEQAPAVGTFQTARNGYNVAAWRKGAFAYFAASDLNAGEMAELVAALDAAR